MKVLVTGSAGHLGEALMRRLADGGDTAVGIDVKASPFTHHVGSIADADFARRHAQGVDAILHAATLHKPHVATHPRRAFVDTNVTGTLNLLEAAAEADVGAFVCTSTTSAFGDALRPAPGAPAVRVDETLRPVPRNIYGVTKTAAEDLCALFARNAGLPCIALRTSRFFPEPDDDRAAREAFDDDNAKVNELAFRRVDIADVVDAHRLAVAALQAEPRVAGGTRARFERLVVSAPTPFLPEDAARLGTDAAAVLAERVPAHVAEYARRGWRMFPSIGRVYDSARAVALLGWTPRYTFAHAIERLAAGEDHRSPLARTIGAKGYHDVVFADGPYPTEEERR